MRVKLDIPINLYDLAANTNMRLSRPELYNRTIYFITTDTRDCEKGDLFIPIKTTEYNTERYVSDALQKGCITVSSENPKAHLITDYTDALLKIARYYKSQMKSLARTLAITGSLGKTTTKNFARKIIATSLSTHATYENQNNHIGLPFTVFSAKKNTEALILELGMNHRGEISSLSKTISPDVSIITSISESHIGNLGSRDEIKKAKLEITDGMCDGCLLVPYEESFPSLQVRTNTVSTNSLNADFSLINAGRCYKFFSKLGSIDNITPSFSGTHNISNLAFAISAAQICEIDNNSIISGINMITDADLRQRFIQMSDFTILDDCYNASYDSIKADVEYMHTITSGPKGVMLGDILELGEHSERIHRSIGKMISESDVLHLYCYGTYAEFIAQGALDGGFNPDNLYVNNNVDNPLASIEHIKLSHLKDELILFKASRKMRLDKIIDTMIQEERSPNDR